MAVQHPVQVNKIVWREDTSLLGPQMACKMAV
jgi:hypothetical protein